MKRPQLKGLLAAALAGAGLLAAAGSAQAAVAVAIGEPGFYGSIDLTGAPPPALIYQQPIVAGPPVFYGAPPPPIYLRVPPGYERHWGRYCSLYRACGRPVLFVQDRWYTQTYIPHWHHYHGPPPGYYDHHDHYDDHRHDHYDEHHHDHY